VTTVLYREDVTVGDEVKNGRTQRWGLVTDLEFDGTGRITRLRVKRRQGHGFHSVPRWWSAASITMSEKGSTK
jgi:hypothetical protein